MTMLILFTIATALLSCLTDTINQTIRFNLDNRMAKFKFLWDWDWGHKNANGTKFWQAMAFVQFGFFFSFLLQLAEVINQGSLLLYIVFIILLTQMWYELRNVFLHLLFGGKGDDFYTQLYATIRPVFVITIFILLL